MICGNHVLVWAFSANPLFCESSRLYGLQYIAKKIQFMYSQKWNFAALFSISTFIYSQYQSTYFAAAKFADRNWKRGRAVSFLGNLFQIFGTLVCTFSVRAWALVQLLQLIVICNICIINRYCLTQSTQSAKQGYTRFRERGWGVPIPPRRHTVHYGAQCVYVLCAFWKKQIFLDHVP